MHDESVQLPDGTDGDGTETRQPVPLRLAHRVCTLETGLRRFLDSLVARQLSGDRAAVRDELRGFVESDFETYKAVLLTVSGPEKFFDDLREADADEETLETLRELHESYAVLGDEFELVLAEWTSGVRNHSLGISTTVMYDEDLELPLLESELTSLEVPLCEFRIPPSEALQLAATLITLAGRSVDDTLESGEAISQEERMRCDEQLTALASALEDVRDAVEQDDIDGQPSRNSLRDGDVAGENYYFD